MHYGLNLVSGTPFNLLTIVIGLVGIGIAGYFGVRSLRVGQRRLSVVAFEPAPLLTDHSQNVPSLQVTHNGAVLPDPHILTFTLENHGQAAIDSACFDRNRPIR